MSGNTLTMMQAATRAKVGYHAMLRLVMSGEVIGAQDDRGKWHVSTISVDAYANAQRSIRLAPAESFPGSPDEHPELFQLVKRYIACALEQAMVLRTLTAEAADREQRGDAVEEERVRTILDRCALLDVSWDPERRGWLLKSPGWADVLVNDASAVAAVAAAPSPSPVTTP